MNAIGSDPRELRRSAAELDDMAASLHAAARSIHGLLFTTPWHGPFADGFRDEWSSRGRLYLNQAAGELERAAGDLRRNADEQDQASGARESSSIPRQVGATLEGGVTATDGGLALAAVIAALPGHPIFGALKDIKNWTDKVTKLGVPIATGLHLTGVAGTLSAVGTGIGVLNVGISAFEATKGFMESGENWWKNTDAWADTASMVGSIVMLTVPGPVGLVVGGSLVAGAFLYEHREEIGHAVDTVVDTARHVVDDAARQFAPIAVDAVRQTTEIVNNAVNAVRSFFPPWRH